MKCTNMQIREMHKMAEKGKRIKALFVQRFRMSVDA